MKPLRTALVLSMCCSAALSACTTTKRAVVPLKPPVARLECQTAGTRPIIPPEHVIDWQRVQTVPQARSQHDAYVKSVRTREGVVAGYIVTIEGVNFACSNNAAWLREFFAGLPDQ